MDKEVVAYIANLITIAGGGLMLLEYLAVLQRAYKKFKAEYSKKVALFIPESGHELALSASIALAGIQVDKWYEKPAWFLLWIKVTLKRVLCKTFKST